MYILQCYVGNVWTSLLCESPDCPSPTLVVVNRMSQSARELWIEKYAEQNRANPEHLRFVNLRDVVTIG